MQTMSLFMVIIQFITLLIVLIMRRIVVHKENGEKYCAVLKRFRMKIGCKRLKGMEFNSDH